MQHCTVCQRSNIAQDWAFCPDCGSRLTAAPTAAAAPAAAEVTAAAGVTDVVIGLALGAALDFVQRRFQQKLQPISQLLGQGVTAAPSVSSSDWPDWYSAAVQEQQRTMSPTELARLQAKEITDAQNAVHMVPSMIDFMRRPT